MHCVGLRTSDSGVYSSIGVRANECALGTLRPGVRSHFGTSACSPLGAIAFAALLWHALSIDSVLPFSVRQRYRCIRNCKHSAPVRPNSAYGWDLAVIRLSPTHTCIVCPLCTKRCLRRVDDIPIACTLVIASRFDCRPHFWRRHFA